MAADSELTLLFKSQKFPPCALQDETKGDALKHAEEGEVVAHDFVVFTSTEPASQQRPRCHMAVNDHCDK